MAGLPNGRRDDVGRSAGRRVRSFAGGELLLVEEEPGAGFDLLLGDTRRVRDELLGLLAAAEGPSFRVPEDYLARAPSPELARRLFLQELNALIVEVVRAELTGGSNLADCADAPAGDSEGGGDASGDAWRDSDAGKGGWDRARADGDDGTNGDGGDDDDDILAC